jgi:gliding motility-associated-like protein
MEAINNLKKLNRFKYILLLSIGYFAAHAQPYASRKGSFQVNQKQGCAPLSIAITQLVDPQYLASYNYEGGAEDQTKTHTFNTPGTYKIIATYQGGVNLQCDSNPALFTCNSDDITIVVTPNVQPAFEISSCSAGRVSIRVTNTDYGSYIVDFDNNLIDDTTIPGGGAQSAMFTYPTVGPKNIAVRGKDLNSADNCTKELQSFTALAVLPAATINTLTVLDASSIRLDYSPAANIQYRAQVANNSSSAFQPFLTFNSASATPQTTTLPGLATDDNYYCFRVNAHDPCNNTSVPSNTICSVNLDLNIVSAINRLSWATPTLGITDFTIERGQTAYQSTAITSYDDTNIICNTDYCYSIATNYANGSRSFSLEKCGKSFTTSTPAAIENTSAAASDNSVELRWVLPPGYTPKTFSVNRSQGSGPFEILATSIPTNYIDNSYSTFGNYCYRINYADVCDNPSPNGNVVCPIQLAGTLGALNEVQLNWSAYLGWKIGVKQYVVERYDSQGNLLGRVTSLTPSWTDNANDPNNQIVEYVVKAEPNDAVLTPSVSNRIRVTKQARLIFPTAFTPNQDQLNDNFTVVGQFVESMTLQIFDRWGTLLFSTEKNEPWNGTHGSRTMPESTYIWKAIITDKTGMKVTKIGSVALLRK